MCGISGILRQGRSADVDLEHTVETMARRLHHRGPDRLGSWVAPDGQIAFGHARLSVIDVSPAGDQPMTSSDGRWTITYNGEIYNAGSLRADLGMPKSEYRGHSDTEILLECIAAWGIRKTLERAVGMFAFACWDNERSQLWLARDRFGEKPLYYARHGRLLIFASQISALRAVPGFRPTLDRIALGEYFRWTSIPAPLTIFQEVSKLQPGHLLHVTDPGPLPEPVPYWSPVDEAVAAAETSAGPELLDEFEAIFEQVVADRMVADVPLGAFLSGGIDSSAVVAMMQKMSTQAVRTFTISFPGTAFDEGRYAAAVAQHLGTDHTELVVTPEDAMGVIPLLPTMYDEPFADSSQVPTHLVSRMAREHVTVALSGDGGDELFGGYERYRRLAQMSRLRDHLPAALRRQVGRGLLAVPMSGWDGFGQGVAGRVLPSALRHRTGHRMHKLARVLMADGSEDLYGLLMSIDNGSDRLVLDAGDRSRVDASGLRATDIAAFSPAERSMLIDTQTYLPDDLLTKVDRASMAVGLEVRAPFLDPGLFRFAWGPASDHRIRDGQGKWIVRQSLRRVLPDHLIDRPKVGFGIPIDEWLRGPLRPWADDLLDPAVIAGQGYLDPGLVAGYWRSHCDRTDDFTYQLWAILMFQAWLAEAGP